MNSAFSHISFPASVTEVKIQVKNKNRYSVFTDAGFLIGVSESTLLDFGLKRGSLITEQTLKEIQKAENYFRIKQFTLGLLARREHSCLELIQKATKKDYEKEVVRLVIDELQIKDFINESRFARQFVHDKLYINKWGPGKIKMALKQKGIAGNTAKEALETVIKQEDVLGIIKKLAEQKLNRLKKEADLRKKRQKVLNYLIGKGFSFSEIQKIENLFL